MCCTRVWVRIRYYYYYRRLSSTLPPPYLHSTLPSPYLHHLYRTIPLPPLPHPTYTTSTAPYLYSSTPYLYSSPPCLHRNCFSITTATFTIQVYYLISFPIVGLFCIQRCSLLDSGCSIPAIPENRVSLLRPIPSPPPLYLSISR